MYTNPMRDIYSPGTDITCRATTAVTGKRFAEISGDRSGGKISITTATPAGHICGVIKYDANANELVGIARGSSRVVTVTAQTAITAGARVEVGTDGKATVHASGVPVGYAVSTAKADADAEISLYN